MTTTLSRPPAVKKPEPKGSPAGVRAIKRVLPSGLQLIILTLLVLFPVGFVILAAFTDTSPGPGSLGEASFTTCMYSGRNVTEPNSDTPTISPIKPASTKVR